MNSIQHNHTEYSLFDATSDVKGLAERAKELGYTSVALTDHGTTSGLFAFYKVCKKVGIKPILGCEFYIVPDVTIKERSYNHLVVYAKNAVGYRNMLKMASVAAENTYYKPRIDYEILDHYKEGLIITSACLAGPLMVDGEFDGHRAFQLHEMFGDDFYLEIQPNTMPEQHEYNKQITALAVSGKMKLTIGIDSHYLKQEDAKTHREWKGLDEVSTYYSTDDYYIMSPDDVKKNLNYIKRGAELAIAGVNEIADKCNVEIETGGQHYPVFPVADPLEHLKSICREGWRQHDINHKPNRKEYTDRILHEFATLDKLNYCNYFCIIHNLVNWAKDNHIRVGAGRGSVVASLVSYLCDITGLDPIRYGLVFERFAHTERVTPADK